MSPVLAFDQPLFAKKFNMVNGQKGLLLRWAHSTLNWPISAALFQHAL